MQTVLLILQILKLFLDLWRETDAAKSKEKADKAKEIVDAFAKADPAERASALNSIVGYILRDKKT